MERLTYKAYCENPAIREQIEEDVRRLRQEAVTLFIVRPIVALFDRTVDMAHAAFKLGGWKSI